MKFKNSLKIENLKLKIHSQSGEIATVLTLISVGLMLLGVAAGKVAVQQTTNTQSRAGVSCSLISCKSDQLKAWLGLSNSQISNASVYLSTDATQFYTGPSCTDTMSDDEGRRICTASSPAATDTPPPISTATPPPVASAAPNKQLGAGNYVVCSDVKTENGGICASGKNGEKQFCYHECRPDKPGYSQAVWCSGLNGYEVEAPEKDPVCDVSGPAPTAGAECSQKNGQPIPDMQCTHVACDGLNWVQMGFTCFDGHAVEMPGKVLRAGNCGDPIPTCIDGKVAPTAALVNPTKSPNQHGFHIGSEIYTYNRDKGVEFQFNVKFYYDGCDGDIQLEQNGNKIAGVNGWKGPNGDYPYSPQWTNSPVLGNGQVQDFTYTGRLVNYHCKDGKAPDNLTDSIKCRLAVDDLGNPRLSGTGCTWMNQGEVKPTSRPTITPGQASNSNSGGAQDCHPYQCTDGSNKSFSVKNRKLYNSGDCSGNSVNSYSGICGGNLGTGCDLVSGNGKTGSGHCVDENANSTSTCKSYGNYTGNAYPRWGPPGNDVDIPLCAGQTGQLCCEPNTGPNRGFLPEALPTILLTGQPQSSGTNNTGGADSDCEYTYPSAITNGTPFSVSVKSKEFNTATGLKLKIKTNPEITIEANSNVKHEKASQWTYSIWDFQNIKIPDAGTYTMSMVFNSTARASDDTKTGTECTAKPNITVNSSSSSTPALTGTNGPQCQLTSTFMNRRNITSDQWTACASCIDQKFSAEINKKFPPNDPNYKGCTPKERATEWCATTPNCIDQIIKTDKCGKKVKDGGCLDNNTNNSPIQPQSYSNEGFQTFIDGIKKGIYSILQASLYVLNATRAPGLQIQYCNPLNGTCDFSSPVGT